MTRLPSLSIDQATEDQRALWERVVETRGRAVEASGDLAGPFRAMVQRPHVGAPLLEVGRNIRFESSLDPVLLEIAICTVGARWRSEFEFWAHRRLAVAAGVDESVLDALAAGATPELDEPIAAAVYHFSAALVGNGKVPADVYDAAVDAIGVDSVVDLTMTIGYYTQICFILNAFDVALPEGVSPTWPG